MYLCLCVEVQHGRRIPGSGWTSRNWDSRGRSHQCGEKLSHLWGAEACCMISSKPLTYNKPRGGSWNVIIRWECRMLFSRTACVPLSQISLDRICEDLLWLRSTTRQHWQFLSSQILPVTFEIWSLILFGYTCKVATHLTSPPQAKIDSILFCKVLISLSPWTVSLVARPAWGTTDRGTSFCSRYLSSCTNSKPRRNKHK